MGGRGSSSGLSVAGAEGSVSKTVQKKSRFSSVKASDEKETSKSSKKVSAREDTVQFIKKQTGVDVSRFIDEKYSNRAGVDLSWKEMTKNEQYAIRNLANKSSRYTLQDNGGLGMFLRFNRKR